eukprot:c20731_g1_i1.p1 GENE.c20731_g1_i1~~c20731_g1_i1.p1  ORF type:complete len:173 (-),score=23.50 c20731_g1_i1:99-617(-)
MGQSASQFVQSVVVDSDMCKKKLKCTKLPIRNNEESVRSVIKQRKARPSQISNMKSDQITLFESTPARCLVALNSMVADFKLEIPGSTRLALGALEKNEIPSEIEISEKFEAENGEFIWVIISLEKTGRGNVNLYMNVIKGAASPAQVIAYLINTQVLGYSKKKGVYEYLLE